MSLDAPMIWKQMKTLSKLLQWISYSITFEQNLKWNTLHTTYNTFMLRILQEFWYKHT